MVTVVPFEYAVVLTGSIGTGKSTVADFFHREGYEIIDADRIAHKILDTQSEAIATIFGDEVLNRGKVDRKVLGKIVFADPRKRKLLESLIHPLIYHEIEKRASLLDEKQTPYLVDIPLFFETARYPIDKILLVYATEAQQLERVCKRDVFSKKEAQQRIASQLSIEEKRKHADYVVDNSGDLEQQQKECQRVKEEIEKDFL